MVVIPKKKREERKLTKRLGKYAIQNCIMRGKRRVAETYNCQGFNLEGLSGIKFMQVQSIPVKGPKFCAV